MTTTGHTAHFAQAVALPLLTLVVDITTITEKVATDIDIAKAWKPGTLKDDGKRGGAEKGFRN